MAFVDDFATAVTKVAKEKGYKIVSPVIAQAIIESDNGTSNKVIDPITGSYRGNYLGIKYNVKTPNRCPSANGFFTEIGSEQRADGSYETKVMTWYSFDSIESCCRGYYEFLENIYDHRYDALKNITDPLTYITILKTNGYATSKSYIDTVYNKVVSMGLTKYDTLEQPETPIEQPINSPLVTYTNLTTQHYTKGRNGEKIDTITPHCYVGQVTAKQGCDYFATTKNEASCNYVIGYDGSIGLCVEESNRSWCSSNKENDYRAVTIEVASEQTDPYAITDLAMASLINLMADICKRNGIKELKWQGDKSLIGQIDKQNITVHRWFKNKACPGEYIYSRLGEIAEKVNAILNGGEQPTPEPAPQEQKYWRVQCGAFKIRNNAELLRAKLIADGFNSIIKQYGDLYKVQCGAFRVEANAEDLKRRLILQGYSAFVTYS